MVDKHLLYHKTEKRFSEGGSAAAVALSHAMCDEPIGTDSLNNKVMSESKIVIGCLNRRPLIQ